MCQAWAQLLSSWASYFTVVAHRTACPCCLAGLVGLNISPVAACMPIVLVCCLLLIGTWLLSTGFGDWRASQSFNPSRHHTAHQQQNTAAHIKVCHLVPLVGMVGRRCVWPMVVGPCPHGNMSGSEVTETNGLFGKKMTSWLAD